MKKLANLLDTHVANQLNGRGDNNKFFISLKHQTKNSMNLRSAYNDKINCHVSSSFNEHINGEFNFHSTTN